MSKIAKITLKAFLQTQPVTESQKRDITRWMNGWDFNLVDGVIPIFPAISMIPMPSNYEGSRSVKDIIEISTGEGPSDRMRIICLEGERLEYEPGREDPPMQVIFEHVNGEQPNMVIIPGIYLDALRLGIEQEIHMQNVYMGNALTAAHNAATRAVELQSCI